jgi:hypothetical protein
LPAVLRLATLMDRTFRLDDQGYALQTSQLDALDALCRPLGVPMISQFIDLTALELREASLLLQADGTTVATEPDPVTGLDWSIEDAAWHPAPSGLTCLEALIGHLERNSPALASVPQGIDVLDALRHWCALLTPLESEGGQFHLAAD